jgi:hypothetical protein
VILAWLKRGLIQKDEKKDRNIIVEVGRYFSPSRCPLERAIPEAAGQLPAVQPGVNVREKPGR